MDPRRFTAVLHSCAGRRCSNAVRNNYVADIPLQGILTLSRQVVLMGALGAMLRLLLMVVRVVVRVLLVGLDEDRVVLCG
jgi:hypothetical protein